jgi:hypothetical protein
VVYLVLPLNEVLEQRYGVTLRLFGLDFAPILWLPIDCRDAADWQVQTGLIENVGLIEAVG